MADLTNKPIVAEVGTMAEENVDTEVGMTEADPSATRVDQQALSRSLSRSRSRRSLMKPGVTDLSRLSRRNTPYTSDPLLHAFFGNAESLSSESENGGGDGSPQAEVPSSQTSAIAVLLVQSIAALGVIYGDIGTSPLYTFSAIFYAQVADGQVPGKSDIIGALSAVIYTLFLVVCVKYCGFVLRSDYHMEGGTFALYQRAMTQKNKLSSTQQMTLLCLTCIGASLLLGESAITPAISVLSALEGIQLEYPQFEDFIVYVALVILLLLFLFQSKGTERVGIVFGPAMVLWFFSIGAIGIYELITYGGDVLVAFSPVELFRWFTTGFYAGSTGWKTLASVVLTVTGTEALFADMGHFGRTPTYLSWFAYVLPCLLLQYCGQAAYCLHISNDQELIFEEKHDAYEFVFWSSIRKLPSGLYYAMILLATTATIVASQALITGAFTLMSQASVLKILPKLSVVHTSPHQKGQVYIGSINFILCVLCCALVLGFQTSANLAAAYGCAVTSVFCITTTIICFFIAPYVWCLPWTVCIFMFVFQGTIDALFLSSNLLKVPQGGWFPLLLGLLIVTVMGIWKSGKVMIANAQRSFYEGAGDGDTEVLTFDDIQDRVTSSDITRNSGLAIFMTPVVDKVPMAMMKLVSRLSILPRYVVLLTVRIHETPFVDDETRVTANCINEDLKIYSITADYGWAEPLSELNAIRFVKDAANIPTSQLNEVIDPALIARLRNIKFRDRKCSIGFEESLEPISVFTSHSFIQPDANRGWFKRTVINSFSVLRQLFNSNPVEYFNLPPNNTTEVGSMLFL